MTGNNSRLLRVVVAAMLLNAMPDGRADTTDLDHMRAAIPDDDDYWYDAEEHFAENYGEEESDGQAERSGSDGDASEQEKQAECAAIAEKAPSGCNLTLPPTLVMNGCGSGATANVIPDYLIVNGAPVLTFGPIFRDACNVHDTCYGTYPGDKEACDLSLNTHMVADARAVMTLREWFAYGSYVSLQALGYSAGLQAPFVESVSTQAFNAAQLAGACRFYARKAREAGCH